jgi:hypothetical protein
MLMWRTGHIGIAKSNGYAIDLTRRTVSLCTERTLTIDDSKTRGKRRRGVLGGLGNEWVKFWRVKYCTILSPLCIVTALHRWLIHERKAYASFEDAWSNEFVASNNLARYQEPVYLQHNFARMCR